MYGAYKKVINLVLILEGNKNYTSCRVYAKNIDIVAMNGET